MNHPFVSSPIYMLIILIIGVLEIIKISTHLGYFTIKNKNNFDLKKNLTKFLNPFSMVSWLTFYYVFIAIIPLPIIWGSEDVELIKKRRTVNIIQYIVYLFIILAIVLEKTIK